MAGPGKGRGGGPSEPLKLDFFEIEKTLWKLGLTHMRDRLSLREYYACAEAHGEYHGSGKKEPEPMSQERLDELGVGQKVIITDFRGGNGNGS